MTSIKWTDTTDNIITVKDGGWWCRKISSGCDNCYAANLNQNTFFGGNKLAYSGQPPALILRRDILWGWARQTKPKKHFVASMTDVFGEWVDIQWHFEILNAMWNAPKQTFQLLTKRPHVMRNVCLQWMQDWDLPRMPDNIWLGTTVENQETANKRIPILLEIPAEVRWLSVEPLLTEVDLSKWMGCRCPHDCFGKDPHNIYCPQSQSYVGSKASWVVVGGESGKDARPCNIDWVRSLVKQCKDASIPVFIKQMGSNPIFSAADHPGHYPYHCITGKGGNIEEFPKHLQIREFPNG